MSEAETTGVKKFLASSDKFFDKVSLLLDTFCEDDSLTLDTAGREKAKDIADLIYKTAQSVKILKEGEVKKENETNGAQSGSRVDRNADKKRSE